VRAVLIALSLLAGVITPGSSAFAALSTRSVSEPGSVGIRIVDVPASASRTDPLALSYIVNGAAPGATIKRQIEISNSTNSTAAVAVYPAAAVVREGSFIFSPGHNRNGLSSWTSISRAVVRLQPRTRAFETVTIRVPKDASSGERYAVIWAEVSSTGSGGVRLANRVGIRMYLSVGPGGAARSSFVIIGSLSARRLASGQPFVSATIHNDGLRTIAVSGTLTLGNGPGGVRAGPFPVKLGVPLSPGASRSVTVRLDKQLPRGPWRAELRLRGRSILRVAVATLTFPR
jgi:hypothetical protein